MGIKAMAMRTLMRANSNMQIRTMGMGSMGKITTNKILRIIKSLGISSKTIIKSRFNRPFMRKFSLEIICKSNLHKHRPKK